MELRSYFEKQTWSEWTQRLNKWNHYQIRKVYFPHSMDALEENKKEFANYRRKIIKTIISRHKELMLIDDNIPTTSPEDKKIWSEKSQAIKALDKDMLTFVKEKRVDDYIDQICALENERLDAVIVNMSKRVEQKMAEDAANTLLCIREQEMANEKRRITNERKKRAREDAKENTPRVRRSARVRSRTSDDPRAQWYRGTFFAGYE